jgi:hypothetical protein
VRQHAERELEAAEVAEKLVVALVVARAVVGGEEDWVEAAVALVGGKAVEVDAAGTAQAVVHACRRGSDLDGTCMRAAPLDRARG